MLKRMTPSSRKTVCYGLHILCDVILHQCSTPFLV